MNRKFIYESSNRALIAAENKAGERVRRCCDPIQGLV
jgi:hypothetical protein